MEHFVVNSIMDFRLGLRMKSVVRENLLPSRNSRLSPRLSMLNTGNAREKSPVKVNPLHPIL
jgi:hypothetical protein